MNDNTQLQLQLSNISEHKEFLSITRMLAHDLMKNPYLIVGDFIQSISNEELDILVQICDDEQHPRLDEIMVIAEMLATGEGLEQANIDIITERVNQLNMFLILESLKRKELIRLNYQNMSFGEDCKDKIIAEKF